MRTKPTKIIGGLTYVWRTNAFSFQYKETPDGVEYKNNAPEPEKLYGAVIDDPAGYEDYPEGVEEHFKRIKASRAELIAGGHKGIWMPVIH